MIETQGYRATGATPAAQAADASLQEVLDELEPSDLAMLSDYCGELTDYAIDMHCPHDAYLANRARLVDLLLHHGWVPPYRTRHPLPEADEVDHGTVQRWLLAMTMRKSAGIEGELSPAEEMAWMNLAEQAVHLAGIYHKETE